MILSLPLAILPSHAQASTVYDDNYTTMDSLFYGDVSYYGINCPLQDVSYNFLDIFSNPDYWVYTGEYDIYWSSLENAVEDGSLAVSVQQNRMSTGYDANLNVFWNETGGEITFQNNNVIAGGTGSKMAQLYMRQDLLGSGGCVPAIRAFGGGGVIATNPGVDTSTTTNGFYHSNYFASGWTVTYPTGYEGELIREEGPPAKYVAMGDSFSSGEGVESFEPGTDVGGSSENRCHRSFKAYSHLLKDELELGSMDFVACSGATTSDLIFGSSADGSWGEGSQLNALSDDTEVVTLTIGGNDVGFSEFAKKCVSPLNWPGEEVCDEFTDAYDDITDAILNDLPSSLESVYELILDSAPNAEIYVGGYPIVAPWMASNEPFDQDCGGLYDEAPTNTWGDARAAYDVVTSLNAIIETAVLDVMVAESTTRLHFVDVESGAFSGHDICESDSYFNGIDFFNPEYSVHPNIDGQAAYAADFEVEMD